MQSPSMKFNYYSSRTQILIHTVLVCALLFLLIQTRPCFFSCYMSALNFHRNGSRTAQSCTSFLYEIIHPSGGSQLANTQVPVICSKCVILALVALFLGRANHSHAVICALLSHSLCPPWAVSWSFDLELVHLRWWRNMPNSTMLHYRGWHKIHVSCSDEPGSL